MTRPNEGVADRSAGEGAFAVIDTDSDPLAPSWDEAIEIARAGYSDRSSKQLRPYQLDIVQAATLCKKHKSLRPAVIEGLLRTGEVANVIAPPKFGKSWLVLGMAISIARGTEWLGFDTHQQDVLLIDNELHEETLSDRISWVCKNLECEIPPNLWTVELRGRSLNINEIELSLQDHKDTYGLIVLDALYRFLPKGTNENDNADMMAVYNTIDSIARHTNAAIAVVHHSTKGSQADKEAIDVGAGAGSIARAADTHLVLRAHELDGCAVLDASTRSWPQNDPQTLQFEFPLWSAKCIEPVLKKKTTGIQARQSQLDQEADDAVLKALAGQKLTGPQLRSKVPMGAKRIDRALARLSEAKKIVAKRAKNRKTGKSIERWECTPECTPECSNIADTWQG